VAALCLSSLATMRLGFLERESAGREVG
jgi:hypothetical protein